MKYYIFSYNRNDCVENEILSFSYLEVLLKVGPQLVLEPWKRFSMTPKKGKPVISQFCCMRRLYLLWDVCRGFKRKIKYYFIYIS